MSAHWNRHSLRDALSSVSEKTMKRAKKLAIFASWTYGTVALSGAALEIQPCHPRLE